MLGSKNQEAIMIRNKPCDAAVYGVDLGKNVFQVVGVDATGRPIQRVKFKRETILQFFELAKPAIVGMEACPGSQWLARKSLLWVTRSGL